MRWVWLAAALPLLSSCAGHPAVLTPVPVAIPVAVPCAVVVARPAFATQALAADAGLFARARAVLAELEQRKAYEAELEAVTLACGGTDAPDTRPKS